MRCSVSELRVAKWTGAFEFQVQPPAKLKTGDDKFDKDPDRFHVRVVHPTAIGLPFYSIQLSTDSPGVAHDDDATWVVLFPVAGTVNAYETLDARSQILVSNNADNKYKINDIANNAVNDRSHIVALDGEVIVQADGQFRSAQVKVVKEVYVDVKILTNSASAPLIGEPFTDLDGDFRWTANEKYTDINGNNQYDAKLNQADANARVLHDLRIAKETYAQIGIALAQSIPLYLNAPPALTSGIVTVPPAWPISGDNQLSPTERALVQAGYNSPAPLDVELYYVGFVRDNKKLSTRAIALASDAYTNMTTTDVNDTIIISTSANWYTVGHEIQHIALQYSKHDFPVQHLVRQTTRVVEANKTLHTDTKRLTVKEETRTQKSEYAQNP